MSFSLLILESSVFHIDPSERLGQEHRPLQRRGQPQDGHHVLHQCCPQSGSRRGKRCFSPHLCLIMFSSSKLFSLTSNISLKDKFGVQNSFAV